MIGKSRGAAPTLGKHAIVLGASVAGLLAARVLADFYTTVTVVERDSLDTGLAVRKGVPQGRHTHGLLSRGAQALEELFPGLLDQLEDLGAVVFDGSDLSRLYFCMNGHVAVRAGAAAELKNYNMTRPFLEYHIRRRVSALSNVIFLDDHDILGVCMTASGGATGARVVDRSSGVAAALPADLVVDATGRGSRTSLWLTSFGYETPTEDRVDIDLLYASQLLRLSPGALHETGLIVSPVPGRPTGTAFARCEDDAVFVTAFGMCGRHPPADLQGLYAFIDAMVPTATMAVLRAAEPIGTVAQHRFPSSRWRRYDKLRRFPEGLLVVGDAVCSFNPIYGQGMTVAAVEALVLRDCLFKGAYHLPCRFFRAAAKSIGQAWQLATGGDLGLPEVQGTPPLATRLLNGYIDRVLLAAETDVMVFGQFVKVAWLVDSPVKLLQPSIVRRVFQARGGSRNQTGSALVLGEELPDGVGGIQRR